MTDASQEQAADDAPMGSVIRDGERLGLRYRRALRHPPEKVWRALTESEHLRHWMPCDIVGERRAGAEIELPFWPDHVSTYEIEEPVLHGEITAWQPRSVFEWTWGGDVLRFELDSTQAGTDLTFTTWFEDPESAAGAAGGYHLCLDHLALLLDGDTSRSLTDPQVRQAAADWDARYRERLAAPA